MEPVGALQGTPSNHRHSRTSTGGNFHRCHATEIQPGLVGLFRGAVQLALETCLNEAARNLLDAGKYEAITLGLRHVEEIVDGLPFLEILRLLSAADFKVLLGSAGPDHTPSKVYPCALGRKPILTVFHGWNRAAPILRATRVAHLVTFADGWCAARTVAALLLAWEDFEGGLPFVSDVDWDALRPFEARKGVRQQRELFDAVVSP